MKVELIHPDRYSFQDLRYELGKAQGGELAETTLCYWLRQIPIRPDPLGFYHKEDLEILKTWIAVREELHTFKRFRAFLLENNHAH